MNELFPIFLKLDELHTLVVGAGPVGLEKLEALLRNSPRANITVVASDVHPDTAVWLANHPTVTLLHRRFEESDLEGKDLVILATNNSALNDRIRTFAKAKHLLLNVADKPALCDFYLGSVVQKGNLKLGISTNGKSPTMAKRLKELFNELLPEEIDETLKLMWEYRGRLGGSLKDKIIALNAHTEAALHSDWDAAVGSCDTPQPRQK